MSAGARVVRRTAWILSPGGAGLESQGRGVAEMLDLDAVLKRLDVRLPWRHLPGALWTDPLRAPARSSDSLAPPWPDVVISCGKLAAPIAATIRRRAAGRVKVVQIQRPRMPTRHFDVVVVPRHDALAGDNVVATVGAIHDVTAEKLAAAARRWAEAFHNLPRPLVGVLVGGSNGRHVLNVAVVNALMRQLAGMCRRTGAGLAVTPSPRTGAANEVALARGVAGLPAYVWDGRGDNPYLGILALSAALVVTEDSVSMVSEALSTGKPVHVVALPGRSLRLGRFQDTLKNLGYTRPFTGALEQWTYPVPDDTRRVAALCRARFGWA